MGTEKRMDMDTLQASYQAHLAAGLLESKTIEVVMPSVGEIFCGPVPLEQVDSVSILKHLERIIRTAYQAEGRITQDSYKRILNLILTNGHESTLEHIGFTVFATTNRGVTHEWVRHRVGVSPTQESTRYVNYDPEADRNVMDANYKPKVIYPSALVGKPKEHARVWLKHKERHIQDYFKLVRLGWNPGEARGDLDNDLKASIVMTFNLRSLRHFARLRTPDSAHRDIQVIAKETIRRISNQVNMVLDDIQWGPC